MPPRVKYSREAVLRAAYDIVAAQGIDALNARAIAAKLGCSTQPLFRVFANMDEIRAGVMCMAQDCFDGYIREAQDPDMPLYKRTGMAYIRFARENPQLFKLLFMRDRGGDNESAIPDTSRDYVLGAGNGATGLADGEMERFHMHMWIYVHGLAAMLATNFLVLDDGVISCMLTENYRALLARFHEKAN